MAGEGDSLVGLGGSRDVGSQGVRMWEAGCAEDWRMWLGRVHTFVMCLKLGQGVHSHLAQSTVEQPFGFLLLFLAAPRQGS